MTITIEQLIQQLNQPLSQATKSNPIDFNQVMQVIENEYEFTPTAFKNGELFNQANNNNGSCKIFSFGQLHNLTEQATLNAFGDFYTQDVLQNPTGDSHQNIRQFIKTGWSGIEFKGQALKKR